MLIPDAFAWRRAEERVVLRLRPRRKKRVTWQPDTIDNEGLGRKSSKKCCIFHKEKPVGESSSDESSSADEGEEGSSHCRDHHNGSCSTRSQGEDGRRGDGAPAKA
eukprot:SM000017S02787  [mRNA]  locus=s17:263592:264148:- [translate_table: standard]